MCVSCFHVFMRTNCVWVDRPQDRTPSDLYILEESVKSVKLIGDLPLAKRLEARPSYLTFLFPYVIHAQNRRGRKIDAPMWVVKM